MTVGSPSSGGTQQLPASNSAQEVLSITLHTDPPLLSSTGLRSGVYVSAQIHVHISHPYAQMAQIVTDVYRRVAKLSGHEAASSTFMFMLIDKCRF